MFGPAERKGFHIPEPERSAVMMDPAHNTGPAFSVPSSASEGRDFNNKEMRVRDPGNQKRET